MQPIIQVENLGKKYIIRHEHPERYVALRDVMTQKAKKLFSFPKHLRVPSSKPDYEDFWALKDLNFEINQGDRVGIIGRNGAGKSTLLKILSRITEPSTGRITLKGRVVSLLEVGTGFHPELTGRENIYLNGAILGMQREEIRKKFDEIVDFSGIEQFLDTPVKRYSSGMYVRLAFAVAAHLEPEILIIDEILAVGDAEFQKKCLGKMEDVSKNEGRTVLFVSHNLGAIKLLCNSSIVLNKGSKIFQGDVFESIAKHISNENSDSEINKSIYKSENNNGKSIFIKEIEFKDDVDLDYFRLNIKIKIISILPIKIGINIRLKDGMGFPVGAGFTNYFCPELHQINTGSNTINIKSSKIALATGSYKLSIELVLPGVEVLETLEDCIQFELTNANIGNRIYGIDQNWGYGAVEIGFTEINSSAQ